MNFRNSVEDVCRVCLEKTDKLYPLMGLIPNVDENISNMIKYCTLMEVPTDVDLPNGVCTPCFRTLRIAYNFIQQFKESNRILLENREKGIIKQEYITQLGPLAEVKYKEEQAVQEFDNDNVEEIIIEYNKDLYNYEIFDENSVTISEVSNTVGHNTNFTNDAIARDVPKDISHDELPEGSPEPKFVSKKKDLQHFTCPICKQIFSRFEMGFIKHLWMHEDVKLKCDKCSLETLLTIHDYIQHFRKAHRYQCNICNKSYGKRSGLDYHIKTHRDSKVYKCSHKNCTRSFLTASCLRKHLHTHSESPKFICSKCGSEFKTYGSFQYHQKTHDGNRSYLCTECGQTFLQSVHLKYHMWKHTGIKMFKCDKCKKSYTSQTQLKKHKKKKTCGIAPETVDEV